MEWLSSELIYRKGELRNGDLADILSRVSALAFGPVPRSVAFPVSTALCLCFLDMKEHRLSRSGSLVTSFLGANGHPCLLGK